MLARNLLLALVTVIAARAAAPDGEALYKQRCATCHDGKAQPRMPSHQEVAARTPESVYRAMFEGAMVAQSAGLTSEEGRAIARFLTGKEFGAGTGTMAGKCAAAPGALRTSDADWNGWGNDLANSRYQPKPGLTAGDVPNLKLKWAFAFEGDTVRAAQPTVVGNRVFVGGSNGAVYSLDAATGCTYWKYDAGAMVRNAISIGQAGGKSIGYFGDVRATVHAVDLATGQLVWKMKVDDHPAARVTGSPVFYGGRVYVPVSSIEEASAMMPTYGCCKFRGSIVALDGATGKQIWKSFSVVDPPKRRRRAPTARSFGARPARPSGPRRRSTSPRRCSTLPRATRTPMSRFLPAMRSWHSTSKPAACCGPARCCPRTTSRWRAAGGAPTARRRAGRIIDFGTSPILRTLPGGRRILVSARSRASCGDSIPTTRQGALAVQVGQGRRARRHRVGTRGRREGLRGRVRPAEPPNESRPAAFTP